MMEKTEERLDCVWHDGIRMKDETLVGMAMKAGSYALAEHYLVTLMAHGLMYGFYDYIDLVNEVRAYYRVEKIPVPKKETQKTLMLMPKKKFYDDLRIRYQNMTTPEKEVLLQEALKGLMANHPDLFRKKYHWLGIYLVVRDRLDYGLTQCGFLMMACHATPALWPERLKLTENVFKNIYKVFEADDFENAYFEMAYNPMASLCDTFWDVLMQLFEG